MLGCYSRDQMGISHGFKFRYHIYKFGTIFCVIIRNIYLVLPVHFYQVFGICHGFGPSYYVFVILWRAVLHSVNTGFVGYEFGWIALQIVVKILIFLLFCNSVAYFWTVFVEKHRWLVQQSFLLSLRFSLFPRGRPV